MPAVLQSTLAFLVVLGVLVFVHEFGHHFAGLADEYYTSDVAYGTATERPEPWEPNATADPRVAKWKDLLTAGIDLPSIWPKKEFEQMEQAIQERRRAIRAKKRPEAEMEALFREERGLARGDGAEVFRENNLGVILYVGESGSIAAAAK